MPDLAAPTGYRLLFRLSRSRGAAEIWAAETAAGAPVVLKLLTPEARRRDDLAYRFTQESDLLFRLGGRHGLVRAIAVVVDPPAIVLEPLDPISLRDRIHLPAGRIAPVAPARAAAIGLGLVEAVGWLHRQGVIHRDVKPGNVLFDSTGAVRLVDLGVAAAGDPPRGLPPGWIEERVGTLGRAAPELLADPATATSAVDVYGLGATLYEALSGHLPHDFGPGESEEHYARRIVSGEPPVPLDRRGRLPPPLASVVTAAVAPHPADRPTLSDLGLALHQALGSRS